MTRLVATSMAFLVTIALVCSFTQPGGDSGGSRRMAVVGTRPELILYCGAGIRPAAEALIGAFESERSCKVVPSYAGSGQLLG
jgi:ABC-type molybdate transport system substrate-binding protein